MKGIKGRKYSTNERGKGRERDIKNRWTKGMTVENGWMRRRQEKEKIRGCGGREAG